MEGKKKIQKLCSKCGVTEVTGNPCTGGGPCHSFSVIQPLFFCRLCGLTDQDDYSGMCRDYYRFHDFIKVNGEQRTTEHSRSKSSAERARRERIKYGMTDSSATMNPEEKEFEWKKFIGQLLIREGAPELSEEEKAKWKALMMDKLPHDTPEQEERLRKYHELICKQGQKVSELPGYREMGPE